MPCDINETNWLDSFKSRIACGIGSIPVDQVKTGTVGLQIEALLCKSPTILDGEEGGCDISNSLTLSSIYERIKCGVMLTEAQLSWAQANIYIKEKICCEESQIADVKDKYEIFKAGIHTWAGGAATTDFIPVAGLNDGDLIQTTLVARTATENLVLSVTDHGADKINLTLSANGANGTTKVSYLVLRANP